MTRRRANGATGSAQPNWQMLVLFVVFLAIGFAVYAPALDGAFFSDDQHYVWDNPYLRTLSLANLAAIWSPVSYVPQLVENWAPVHLTAHALEWHFFGSAVRGYHVVNVVLHASAAWLLVLVLRLHGLSLLTAALGGLVFLVHPANVEAVAWISQLKTSACMVLSLAALLTERTRPRLALAFFALALLAKPTAAFVLAVVVADAWRRRDAESMPWARLAAWGLVFALFALAEFAAFFATAGRAQADGVALGERALTIVVAGWRYVVMALAGGGLSIFHEPLEVAGWLAPRPLASLALIALALWRLLVVFRRRSPELLYWLWLGVSFAPISGIIPLPYPLADRYLYFMLPGLIGVLAWSGPELAALAPAALRMPRERGRPLVALACTALVVFFAFGAHARARLWGTPPLLMSSAARTYPDGAAAQMLAARAAAARGDAAGTVESLGDLVDRGYNRLDHLLGDRVYEKVRGDARFQALVADLADALVAGVAGRGDATQVELRLVAQVHVMRGEWRLAERRLEEALARGGPLDEQVRAELEQVRPRAKLAERLRERGR